MKVERDIPLNVVRPDDPAVATVMENRLLTHPSSPHITRHVVLDVGGTPLEGAFEIGQAFGVIPNWETETEENEVRIRSEDHTLRLYSLASPSDGEDGHGRYISTPVKRIMTEHWETGKTFLGVCSNYLCDLDVGDEVEVTGPTGKALLLPDHDERHRYRYLFLATGTGIAPFRGMARELLEDGVDAEIWLIFGIPYSTDILYGSELERLDDEHDNFQMLLAVSREQKTRHGEKMYVQERMLAHSEVFEPLVQDERTLVYICGLKGMESGIYRALLQLGGRDLLRTPSESGELDRAELADKGDEFFAGLKPNRERCFVEVY